MWIGMNFFGLLRRAFNSWRWVLSLSGSPYLYLYIPSFIADPLITARQNRGCRHYPIWGKWVGTLMGKCLFRCNSNLHILNLSSQRDLCPKYCFYSLYSSSSSNTSRYLFFIQVVTAVIKWSTQTPTLCCPLNRATRPTTILLIPCNQVSAL